MKREPKEITLFDLNESEVLRLINDLQNHNVDLNESLDRALNKLCRIKTDNQILNKIINLVKEDPTKRVKF